jgi:hypothetical protein
MQLSIKNRLLKLEQALKNTNTKCFGLDYFYGRSTVADQEPIGTLSDFYASITRKDQQHGN